MIYGQGSLWEDTLVFIEEDFNGRALLQTLFSYDLVTGVKKKILDLPDSRHVSGPPSVYGNRVIWSSADQKEYMRAMLSSRLPTPLNLDVFCLDLTNGQIEQITSEPHGQKSPAIYGDAIVWIDDRNSDETRFPQSHDVYAYNLKAKTETRLTASPTVEGYTDQLSLAGNLVVWSDNRNADAGNLNRPSNLASYNNEIYSYDLTTHQERRITSSPLNDQLPVVDQNRVVWLRLEDFQKADVFAFDLNTGRENQVSQSHFAAFAPAMSGDWVAWVDARISRGNTTADLVINGVRGGAEIYLSSLKTGTETRITNAYPDNSDLNIVWGQPVLSRDYLVFTSLFQVGTTTFAVRLPRE